MRENYLEFLFRILKRLPISNVSLDLAHANPRNSVQPLLVTSAEPQLGIFKVIGSVEWDPRFPVNLPLTESQSRGASPPNISATVSTIVSTGTIIYRTNMDAIFTRIPGKISFQKRKTTPSFAEVSIAENFQISLFVIFRWIV